MARHSASRRLRRPFAASLGAALALACVAPLPKHSDAAPRVAAPEGLSSAARRIHGTALVFDGHNDLPWALRTEAESSFDVMDIAEPQPGLQTDIPRLRAGGLGAQFWSVYVPAETERDGGALRETLEQIDLVHRMIRRYPETFGLALRAADVVRIRREGRIASLLGVEGGYSIEGSLGTLRMLYTLGVRYMTLTHSETTAWADSATDEPEHDGLSPFGEEVVREMNALGMLVDISHVSVETMRDVLDISRAPVIASHSSAFAVAPHVRNVPDDVLRAIGEKGGVVMVNFYSGFVVPESAAIMARKFDVARDLRAQYPDDEEYRGALRAWREANPIEAGTVGNVLDHIDHIVEVAGIDHVGLGSDFDGVSVLPRGLEDVSEYPAITEGLLRRGYDEEQVRKVLGLNTLRVLQEAELAAARLAQEKAAEKNPDR